MTPQEKHRLTVQLRKDLRDMGYLRCPACDRLSKDGEKCGQCRSEEAEVMAAIAENR